MVKVECGRIDLEDIEVKGVTAMDLFNIESLGVKDEILAGEPLYVIKDSTGNVVYDNVRLELKTPLVQEGSPLNKALFDKIEEIGNSVQSMNPVGETFKNIFMYGYLDNTKLDRATIIYYNSKEIQLLLKSINSEIALLKKRVSNLEEA